MVSGIGMLAVDPLGPVGWGIVPPRIRLVPTDARSNWDLGSLGASLTRWAP